ncbi:aminopeptidase P family protein [Tranquillimonas rosea]|uniref:aminopeptidase P family protein n=1 Tax=Tranquillimonas rosea TaxID=641238 RepID=UPI003BA93E92
MFQTFDSPTRPDQGPPRLEALRAQMAAENLDGFLVPRADVHRGEYVAPRDERLSWLTGFTGSAGFAAVLTDQAGVFVDGRYTVQVKAQVDTTAFTPVAWPETKLADWLAERLHANARVGFDPWLHTVAEIEELREALEPKGIGLIDIDNLIDRVWPDQPAPPAAPITAHSAGLAGRDHRDKRQEVARTLGEARQKVAVLTLPDSIAWLFNIRGGDIAHTPVPHGFALVFDSGRAELFVTPGKADGVLEHLGDEVAVQPAEGFAPALSQVEGPVRVDRRSAPVEVLRLLEEAEVEVAFGEDPCLRPKAIKTEAELAGTTEAHLRDGAAMCEFLAWLDERADALSDPSERLTEIDVVTALEGFRRETNMLRDISFDTIAGSGPNGAIVHYRVTEETDRALRRGELLLVDSGGQYPDGTTDITRTVAIGQPGAEHRACFTRVLRGMIAISRTRFPKGLAGRDLDPLARAPLWLAGQDYNHGTGHGVGTFLGVHEGPQALSRRNEVPLEPGMILSNEPGYYREGAFGIRIENLIVVEPASELAGADPREMYAFRTLTWVPIDRRLINAAMLSAEECDWLNDYHAAVAERIGPRLSESAAAWLAEATRPI